MPQRGSGYASLLYANALPRGAQAFFFPSHVSHGLMSGRLSFPPASLRRRVGRVAVAGIALLALLALTRWEMETSTLQAGPFSWSAQRLSYEVAPGPSDSIRFPDAG